MKQRKINQKTNNDMVPGFGHVRLVRNVNDDVFTPSKRYRKCIYKTKMSYINTLVLLNMFYKIVNSIKIYIILNIYTQK